MIYLIVKPRPGTWRMVAFGYQHHWPDLRAVIWEGTHAG